MAGKKAAWGIAGVLVMALALVAGVKFAQKSGEAPQAAKEPAQQEGNHQPGNDNQAIPSPGGAAQGQAQAQAPNPEIAKLNAMQSQIQALSNEAVEAEFQKLTTTILSNGMLDKVNADEVDLNKHPQMKEMLTRIALLRIERKKRGMDDGAGGGALQGAPTGQGQAQPDPHAGHNHGANDAHAGQGGEPSAEPTE